jgi:hypothetical protein
MKMLIFYVSVIFIGAIVANFFPFVWHWFGILDTASAVALAILAFFGYLEFVRSEDAIKIFFNTDGEIIDTELSILRKNFTRGELMGVLGMIQKNSKDRFEIQSLKEISILQRLQQIQTSKDQAFYVKVTNQELSQFHTADS